MKRIPISKEDAVRLVMAFYLGEKCEYCGREYKTLDDLHDTVWGHNSPVCRSCWEENNPKKRKA